MTVLDFSVNIHFLESVQVLQRLLDEFRSAHDCSVALHVLSGNAAWQSQAYYALYGRGADVSEMGSTWVGGLAGMKVLRAFKPAEVITFGGENVFFPSLWQPDLAGDGRVWSVPFLGDSRLIFYWRDMLSRAGVDEQNAFGSIEQVENTLNSLTRIHLTPWAVQTLSDSHNIVYLSCSWVWGAGGDFISPDGKQTTFYEPAARQGLRSYFNLHSFLPQYRQPMAAHQLADAFCQRRVAAMISGPWVLNYLERNLDSADLLSQVGVALPPGPAFVGGSQLAIWRHTVNEDVALALVLHLLKPDVQHQLGLLTGLLPALRLAADGEGGNTHRNLFLRALQQGRNPALLPYWGLLEEYLATAFGQVWGELFENPEENVDAVLDKVLGPLAVYLDRILANPSTNRNHDD